MSRSGPLSLSVLILLLLTTSAVSGQAQIHGSSRLDLVAFPIPCTEVEEIKLDTLCERTVLEFDIESIMNVNVTFSGMTLSLNSASPAPST